MTEKISEIYYEEIGTDRIDINTAGEFYYYMNLLGVHDMFNDDYEKYETNQINLRNNIIGEAIRCGKLTKDIRADKSIMAISSLNNKVALVVEVS